MSTGKGAEGAVPWGMVAIGFLAQNCAVNMASGIYGTVLPVLRSDLQVSSALASSAMGAMLLSIGLLAPVVGWLLQTVSIRLAMSIGAVLVGLGYGVASFAENIYLIIGAFALLIGPGACLMGPISVSTLVSRWFPHHRGKALALANMPLFLLVAPPLGGLLVAQGGHRLVFGAMAAVFVIILPVLQLIREPRPDQGGHAAPSSPADGADNARERTSSEDGRSKIRLVRDYRFWALSIGIGILTGAGIVFVTHSVAMAVQFGLSFSQAPSLVSSFGAGTLAGAILFGWLIDRIGALPSLVLNTLSQMILWILLLACGTLPEFVVLSFVIGCGIGATVALHGASVNVLFGVQAFSRVMGSSYLMKVPFLFGSAPLAGYIFDETGNYRSVLIVVSAAFLIATLLFCCLAFERRLRFLFFRNVPGKWRME